MLRLSAFAAILAIAGQPSTDAPQPAAFVKALDAKRPQTIVTYGTSLTQGGKWVGQFQQALDAKYPKLAKVVNSGKSGMSSIWGLENVDKMVIAKKPNAVLIEFGINDSALKYKTSPEMAKKNLEGMIDKIHAADAKCEIIIMVMSPATGTALERRANPADYEQVYREVAWERALRLVDHSANWKAVLAKGDAEWKRLAPDGLHPNEAGCREIVTPHLLKSLGIAK